MTCNPFSAGFLRFSINDQLSDLKISLSVWYPTHTTEAKRRDGIYDLSAARDAAPAPGRFGVIVVSHGSGGSDINHHDWAEELARNGYIVVAPRHLGDGLNFRRGLGNRDQLLQRPRQLRTALDAILEHPVLGAFVDHGRIGALGFSSGGYTILALLGARPDYSRWKQSNQVFDADKPASDGENGDDVLDEEKLNTILDPRIGAAVLLSPVARWLDLRSLSRVKVPLRVYRAERESVSPNEENADLVVSLAGGKVESVTIPGDHFIFMAPVDASLREKYAEFYQDAPGIDRQETHRRIGKEIVDFFQHQLGG